VFFVGDLKNALSDPAFPGPGVDVEALWFQAPLHPFEVRLRILPSGRCVAVVDASRPVFGATPTLGDPYEQQGRL